MLLGTSLSIGEEPDLGRFPGSNPARGHVLEQRVFAVTAGDHIPEGQRIGHSRVLDLNEAALAIRECDYYIVQPLVPGLLERDGQDLFLGIQKVEDVFQTYGPLIPVRIP